MKLNGLGAMASYGFKDTFYPISVFIDLREFQFS